MPRWPKWVVIGTVPLLVAAAVVSTVDVARDKGSPAVRSARASGQAPSVTIADLRDRTATIAIDDFRGRPLVVNFFAAWCAPCRNEMAALQSVYRSVKDRVAFLGIDTRDIRSDALDLLEATGVGYPTAYDPRGMAAAEFGVLGMPTTFFIDARGKMLERYSGEMSEEQLRKTVDRLFGTRSE
jgi:cytochrome c biogenesis protein CcmG/thiol:disulfide interchange protein DsbE